MPFSLPIIRPQFTTAGSLLALEAGSLSLLQYPATELEPGPQQVWLRFRDGRSLHPHPLTGPACGGTIATGDGSVVISGEHRGVAWTVWWEHPAAGVAGWSVRLRNIGDAPVEVDVVYLLDPALSPAAIVRENEFHVSNYLDVQPLGEPDVAWLAVRQNMPGERNPWMAVGSSAPVAGWCTDARQLAAPNGGLDLTQDLPSERLQGEHTLVGLQTKPAILALGEIRDLRFPLVVVDDHPARTTEADLAVAADLVERADWLSAPPAHNTATQITQTLFSPVSMLVGEDLAEDDFLALDGRTTDEVESEPVEGVEYGPDALAWAYWRGRRHIVAAAKERSVLRPHGHVSRVSAGPRPADVTVASTAWMNGTFASQLTVGHASDAPLLSVRRSYLGLKRADGLRVFVRSDSEMWLLLGAPSAWEVDGDRVRWIYQWRDRRIEVRSELTLEKLMIEIEVISGPPLEILLASHSDAEAEPDGHAELFADGRGGSWQVHARKRAARFTHQIDLADGGDAVRDRGASWIAPEVTSKDESIRRLNRILPSLVADAAVHYQAPRGLEQFTGGAWGTRDVSQGPVGLLLGTDNHAVLRDVLLTVFSAQQTNGNWPQWFQYVDAHRAPGHRASHGDVVYWPLLALGEYLNATGDAAILDEAVSSVGSDEMASPTPLIAHVHAAFDRLAGERSVDPRLPAYGHGDWNDALQPASEELAGSMCSTWTTELEIKALETLAPQLRTVDADLAGRMAALADASRTAFRERLLVDGELCGYSIITDEGLEPLVHPADQRTHVQHGSLQMIHAIGDELLTKDEALHHLALIDEHLDGPTGIYLFDRPIPYHGGVTRTFQRAEAASFWGREIGLMYTHAHIRWVQALLRLGLAERAWQALQLLIPEGVRDAVPGATVRQSNCYYSSSDAGFTDRYDAQENEHRLFDPLFRFEGGWRVYSSGPGLILRLLVEDLLGCRWTSEGLHLDPVMPAVFDGASVRLRRGGRDVVVTYRVTGAGHSVARLQLNGDAVATSPVPRRYRPGGILIPREIWDRLPDGDVLLSVEVGAAAE